MPDDELLTAAEAGTLLGVTGKTVHNWAEDGRLRHVVLPSGRRRFRRSDVLASLVTVERTANDLDGAA